MTHGGRPVERPSQLSQEQRQGAQQRTRQWREQAGLTQAQMAAEIHVSLGTYRPWENGKDKYAGPTRPQTDHLNRTLRRLLGDAYTDGEAFDVWGWPRQQDMTYDQVFDLLRMAGFEVPRIQPGVTPPGKVIWVHKVRRANLLHGVFALAAAACTRAGMSVHLLLDDVQLSDRDRHLLSDLEFRVRTWIAFASGNDSKLTTGVFSEVLKDQHIADRGWQAINDYLTKDSSALEVLLASKAVSPVLYSTQERESILGLMRDSVRADRLLTAIRNWLVFDVEIMRMLGGSAGDSNSILTLGGADERTLWTVWRRGCWDELAARVQHMFLRTMPMPLHESAWDTDALTPQTDRTMLTNYLINRVTPDDDSGLLEWLLRSAIRLPEALNPGFRDGLDATLRNRNLDALLSAAPSELAPICRSVSKAITEWLSI